LSRVEVVVGGSLVVASVLVLIRTITLGLGKGGLKKPLGSPGWNYSQSWASTFTLGAGILGTLLGSSEVVPDLTQFLPVAAYGTLNVLFLVIAGAAPLIYVAFQSADRPEPGIAPQKPHGVVGWFLVAAAVTFWGALGEAATVGLLIAEILLAGTLSVVTAVIWALVVIIAVILMTMYLWKGIEWRLRNQIVLRGGGRDQPSRWPIL